MSAGGGTGGYKDIPLPSPSEGDDEHTLEEHIKSDIKKEREALELLNFRQDINARREYANKLYLLIKWWLIGIGILIICQGVTLDVPFLSKDYFLISFSLSDQVLITILTGTTINVLGLFLVVARYFYKSNEEIRQPSQNAGSDSSRGSQNP